MINRPTTQETIIQPPGALDTETSRQPCSYLQHFINKNLKLILTGVKTGRFIIKRVGGARYAFDRLTNVIVLNTSIDILLDYQTPPMETCPEIVNEYYKLVSEGKNVLS
jgi:hypothetical protein